MRFKTIQFTIRKFTMLVIDPFTGVAIKNGSKKPKAKIP